MDLRRRILVLAPHTDDGELGCGATISRCLEQGGEVYYAAYSSAADSLPPGTPSDQLVIELREATASLKLDAEKVIVYDYAVRKLNFHRQEILESMVKLQREIRPDLVLLPSRQDLHQDHSTVTAEGLRAFKHCTLLGYELPWNNLSFDADAFIRVEERHLEAKIKALACYRTQAGRDYIRPEFTRSLATVRGLQAGGGLAECFEVIRLIV